MISSLIEKIRYIILLFTKGIEHKKNILRMTNVRFFCSTNKILGWIDGHPSYGILTPPVFSKPSAYALTSKIMSLYQWRPLPEMVNLAITDKCACDCEYCSFRSMAKEKKRLGLREWKEVIDQIQELGASTISLTGGEPLENPDILEIVDYVNKDFSQVIMFTSGYLLEKYAKDLKKRGLNSVIVSVNSSDSSIHDSSKRSPGLYEKAIAGIKAAKKAKLLVAMASVVYKKDLETGHIQNIIELGKELKVNQVIFFDTIPTGYYRDDPSVVWNKEETNKLIEICSEYHSKKKYPGVLPYSFINSSRSIGCYGGTIYFYVSPYGDICPCDFCSFSVGNVKDEPLYALWDKFGEHKEFQKSSLAGCKMKNKEFREKFTPNSG
ncbi:MAG: radical SAM protein [bacterium]|nr:radical SAM protein [bacterium]